MVLKLFESPIEFPVYKLPPYDTIDDVLGRIKLIRGDKVTYLDDTHLEGDLSSRRLKLKTSGFSLTPLKSRIDTLRQLVKYPNKTEFISQDGSIFTYIRGKRRYSIQSLPIRKITPKHALHVIYVDKINSPFVTYLKDERVAYASIMFTQYGPFLYDLTREQHAPIRRAI